YLEENSPLWTSSSTCKSPRMSSSGMLSILPLDAVGCSCRDASSDATERACTAFLSESSAPVCSSRFGFCDGVVDWRLGFFDFSAITMSGKIVAARYEAESGQGRGGSLPKRDVARDSSRALGISD